MAKSHFPNTTFRVLLEAQWWGPKGEGRRCGRKGNTYADNLAILALIACTVSDHPSCFQKLASNHGLNFFFGVCI